MAPDEVVLYLRSLPSLWTRWTRWMIVPYRRVIVRNDHRVALDLPFAELRRIQLDIERTDLRRSS
jgi:hypothetical protein